MYYNKSNILLATKHNKENAVTEPFLQHLQATVSVPENYDTDLLGTFTGEIKRHGSMLETVLKKAKDAINQYGSQLALASEGSFGPHPHCFFAPGNAELMAFMDEKSGIVVVETTLTTDTNFAHLDITKNDDYEPFLNLARFGSHGVIVKHAEGDEVIAKGILDIYDLRSILKTAFQSYDLLRIETDMRAMMNPTRMRVIAKLADKLAQRLATACPKCQSPGFGKQSFEGNLPCEVCALDTFLYANKALSCVVCDYTTHLPRDDGLTKAEAKYCQFCNP